MSAGPWLIEISYQDYDAHDSRVFGPYEREGDAWHALQQAGWEVHNRWASGVDADPPQGAYPFDTVDVFVPQPMAPFPKGEAPPAPREPVEPLTVDMALAPDWALPWLASLLGTRRSS